MLSRKLAVFQREPRESSFRARTRWRRRAILVLLEVRIPHRTTGEMAHETVSRSRAEPGRSTQEAQGWQKLKGRTLAGGANLACGGPGGRCPGVCEARRARRGSVSSATRFSRVTVVRDVRELDLFGR